MHFLNTSGAETRQMGPSRNGTSKSNCTVWSSLHSDWKHWQTPSPQQLFFTASIKDWSSSLIMVLIRYCGSLQITVLFAWHSIGLSFSAERENARYVSTLKASTDICWLRPALHVWACKESAIVQLPGGLMTTVCPHYFVAWCGQKSTWTSTLKRTRS